MPIQFKTKPFSIGSWLIVHLPESESKKLSSRGLVMVKGTMNGAPFQCPLEPDGKGSHWLNVDKTLQKAAKAEAGKTVTLTMEPTKDWIEPTVTPDLKKTLEASPKALTLWLDITPLARWDWIRWINATKNPATRAKRIEVTCSKLNAGKRNACCFDRSSCTEPAVSKNGVLLNPQSPLV